MRLYDGALKWSLENRLATSILALLFFIFGLSLFPLMPQSLISPVDRGELTLTVELEPGTTLEESTEVARRLTEIVAKGPGVETVFASIGTATTGGPGQGASNGAVNKITLYGVLAPRGEREYSEQQLEELLRPEVKKVPGARTRFGATEGISGKLTILLASNESEVLSTYADELAQAMRELPILFDVQSSAALARPELLVEPYPGERRRTRRFRRQHRPDRADLHHRGTWSRTWPNSICRVVRSAYEFSSALKLELSPKHSLWSRCPPQLVGPFR